jgi:acetyltransferase-like isoleucine patch superfamily enzyme
MSTFKHLKFIATYPKIGPDMYFTHWLLFFKPFRLWFQKRKLKHIGKNSEIRPYCIILGTDSVIIGDDVIIPEGTRLIANPEDPSAQIIVEDCVLFGPNVAVYCSTHTFSDVTKPIKDQPFSSKTTIIGYGSWIGINSIILPGVKIGRNVVIGANSLVNKDIPDYSVAVGCPARVIRNLKQQ